MTLETMVSILLRGTILLAAIGLVALAARRSSPALRHFVWTVGAVALLVLPVAHVALPALDVAVLPSESPAAATPSRVTVPAEVTMPALPTAKPTPASAPSILPDAPPRTILATAEPVPVPVAPSSRPEWFLVAWLTGVVLVLGRIAVGAFGAARLVRRAKVANDPRLAAIARTAGRGRRIRVRVSSDVDAPLTVGVLRPTILLPAAAHTWPEEWCRQALLHEGAHVRRRDLLAEFTARVATAIHWPNPLAWLAVHRLRIERERACDDLVLTAGSGAETYAEFLLRVARSLRRSPIRSAIAATMAGGARLEDRIRAILDGRRRLQPSRRAAWLLAVAALVPLFAVALLRPTPAQATEDDVITVDPSGRGDYLTISEALEAAEPGATVRVIRGTYEEHLSITKPVVLEGAGVDRTTIVGRVFDKELAAKIWKRFQPRFARVVRTPEKREELMREFAEERDKAITPLIFAKGADGVVLRGFTLTGLGKGDRDSIQPSTVMGVAGSRVTAEDIAVVGSPGSGILVDNESSFEIKDSLVAGVWATGITVKSAAEDRMAKVRISGCDIRNCYHRGIVIGPGNRDVVVEGCRISGSSWHGIRYDDAAPTVRKNAIFSNVRSGIYASGKTAGEIEGNLFRANGMSGVSCWFEAKDRIYGNTFADERREAVGIVGGSDPLISKNVFQNCVVAISAFHCGDSGVRARYADGGRIEDNFFFGNDADLRKPGKKPDGSDAPPVDVPLPEGNMTGDPGLTNGHALREDGAAAKAGAGATSFAALASPWPIRKLEKGPAPASPPAVAKKTPATPKRNAWEISKPWVEDLRQIKDAGKRKAAAERVREALASDDPVVQHAGLMALTQTSQVKYDRRGFRALILPLTRSQTGGAQVQAFYALYNTERKDSDLDLLLTVAKDPSKEMKESLSHLIHMFSKGNVTGEAAKPVLRLLLEDDHRTVREALRGLWGARVSPAIEAQVIELAKNPRSRHDAIYFGLSTFQDKSKAVIEVLVDALADPDGNNSHRALWGLGHGVPLENYRQVADAFRGLLESRTDRSTRSEALRGLSRYGDASDLEALDAIAANEMVDDHEKKAAKDAATRIRARVGK